MRTNPHSSSLIMDDHIPAGFVSIDDYEKDLKLWRRRVHVYFPDLYRNAKEFRFRQSFTDRSNHPSSVLVLENDGSIFEITVNHDTNSGVARLCTGDDLD